MNQVKDKVDKLIRLALGTDRVEEARTAALAAVRLIDQHKLLDHVVYIHNINRPTPQRPRPAQPPPPQEPIFTVVQLASVSKTRKPALFAQYFMTYLKRSQEYYGDPVAEKNMYTLPWAIGRAIRDGVISQKESGAFTQQVRRCLAYWVEAGKIMSVRGRYGGYRYAPMPKAQ